MGVVARFFIRNTSTDPDGSVTYHLGAVCRGDENKNWAAATPAGSIKHGDNEKLAEVWSAHLAGNGPAEVLVYVTKDAMPPEDGGWIFDKCEFSYGGCVTHFRQKSKPWGELSMTINASGATRVLREAYAASLIDGNPAHFAVTFQ